MRYLRIAVLVAAGLVALSGPALGAAVTYATGASSSDVGELEAAVTRNRGGEPPSIIWYIAVDGPYAVVFEGCSPGGCDEDQLVRERGRWIVTCFTTAGKGSFGTCGVPPQTERKLSHIALSPMHDLMYRRNPIDVDVSYDTVADRYGNPAVKSGMITIANGNDVYNIDLARVLPLTTHNILLEKDADGACGLLQPLAIVSHYVAVEVVWAEKGCRPAAYFIDVDSGIVAETVDLDHRWDHRLDVQPVQFSGKPIRVESVDHVTLALATFDTSGLHVKGSSPWPFAIVRGRDAEGDQQLFAYEFAKAHLDRLPDPGWNIFPTVGSVVEVGSLTAPRLLSYHPNPDVLRMSAADDARYAERQPPTSAHEVHLVQRNQWFILMDNDVDAYRFADALTALNNVLLLDDVPSIRGGDEAFYQKCHALVAQLRAGKISAASARTAWSNNGCRIETEARPKTSKP